jgi:hypothetical protein
MLIGLLDGELPALARATVEEHLSACWECRARQSSLERQAEKLAVALARDVFPGPDRIAAAHQRFLARRREIEKSIGDEPRPLLWFLRRMPLVAASVVSAVVIGATGYYAVLHPAITRVAAPARTLEKKHVPRAQEAPLVLPRPVPEASRLPSVRLVPSEADLAAAEIHAHYILHRVRACLGEAVEVSRGPDSLIHVHGIVEKTERKMQLLEALSELSSGGLVRVDLKTVQEAAVESPSAVTQEVATVAAREERLPIQDQLERYFAGRKQESVKFASDAVAITEAALSEAWALRRLAGAHVRWKSNELHPESERLVGLMVDDHARALEEAISSAETIMKPVLGSIAPAAAMSLSETHAGARAAGWAPAGVSLLEQAQSAQRLAHGLFAGAGLGDETPETAASKLLGIFEQARLDLEHLRSQTAGAFESRRARQSTVTHDERYKR